MPSCFSVGRIVDVAEYLAGRTQQVPNTIALVTSRAEINRFLFSITDLSMAFNLYGIKVCFGKITSMSKPLLQIVPDAQNTRNYQFIRDTIDLLNRDFQQEIFWFAERRTVTGLIRSLASFHKFMRQKSFGLAHCQYGGINLILGLYAKWVFKTPLIVTLRGSDVNNAKSFSSRISALTSRLLASVCDHVICVSRPLSKKLMFVRASKISIIPTGVDTQKFFPRNQAEARSTLGLTPNRLYLLFNEGARPLLKGRPFVDEVLAIVQKTLPQSSLIVLDGTVGRDEIPLYMAAADCLLLASYAEGSPNVVKESLCCNLPVVSLNVGDVEELLHGISPSSISASSPTEFANKVLAILASKMRSNGETKSENLSKRREIESLSKIYRSFLGGQK